MRTIPFEEAAELGLIAKKTKGGNPDERRFPYRAVAGPYDATPTDDRLLAAALKGLPEDCLIVNDRGSRTIYRPAPQVKLGRPGRKVELSPANSYQAAVEVKKWPRSKEAA